MTAACYPIGLLTTLIARIDQLIEAQVNAILHHERFQQLESAWRGLQLLLLEQKATSKYIKVRILDASWHEVSRDIERALNFDQSLVFSKIYTHEFDMPGGEPFGVMLCNYTIDHRKPGDILTLRGLAAVAAASFCPFFLPAPPSLLGLEKFSDLESTFSLDRLFQSPEYIGWKQLRKLEDTRFLGFVLPGILMRVPWGIMLPVTGRLRFREQIQSHRDLLWGHAGFALGQVLIREFDQVGWFAHIRGAPRDTLAGGVVTQLTGMSQKAGIAALTVAPSTEVVITDTKERELANHGLIALAHCWNTPFCAFFNLASLYESEATDNTRHNSNTRISGQIQNILCASRIAHYIKVMMRDKVGSFMTAQDCEEYLAKWLEKYSIANDSAEWSTQARYPLRMFRVEVSEDPWRTQHFLCNIFLTPHYQVDGIVSEIKLSTELVRA